MNRVRRAVLLAIPLFVSAAPQEPVRTTQSPLDGIWRFIFESDKLGVAAAPSKTVAIKSKGSYVQVIDPATSSVFFGKADSSSTGKPGRFTIDLRDASHFSGLVSTPASGDAIFEAYLDGDKLSGSVKLNDVSVTFKAIKLTSAWECSGHPQHKADEPAYHVASDADEMRNYSTKYGCHGWHRLQTQ